MTSSELIDLVKAKYKQPEYVFLEQVRNGTGWQREPRTADALAMSVWPSRGLELIGFEIKVNRSDWLKEKNQPQKAEEIARFCDRWYLVTPDDQVATAEEIPKAWGWYALKKTKLKVMKPADRIKAEPVSRLFLAAVLRKAAAVVLPAQKIQEAVKKGHAQGLQEAREQWKSEIENQRRKFGELKTAVEEFETHSGIKINAWDGGKQLGQIVTVLSRRDYLNQIRRLGERLKAMSESFEKDLEKILTEFPEAHKIEPQD